MPSTKKTRNTTIWGLVGAAVGIAGLLGGAALAGSTAVPSDDSASTSDVAPAPDTARRVDGDVTAMGDVDAPVVLVEYADYRCPFCGVFARDTMPSLIEEYVDRGLLRIEWRDLPVFGDDSVRAAVAVRAAGEQGLFWEYHEALYAQAPDRGHPPMPAEKLIAIAESIGVPDLAQFEDDLLDDELHRRVSADVDEAHQLGASATPVFLINGVPIAGAQPTDVFRDVIDERLEAAG
jgi:protein-disulfide isomerase